MTIRHLLAPLVLGLVSLSCAWSQQYTISTYAGNGTVGFAGDSGAATSAEFSSPVGIVLDASGNMYIADTVNQRIRKISGGTITTIAGNGTGGFTGDSGPATSAEMLNPAGVALDSAGNLYIADTSNHLIRMVSTAGTITTIAGNNTGGYAGDGGLATSAELEFPTSVAVDAAGNIYIADSGNHVIREVSGGNISTIVGTTSSTLLNNPTVVLVDSKNNLYIAEQNGLRIVKYSLSTGVFTVLAGNGNIGSSGDNGPAVDAALDEPTGIALDSAGYLYLCDTDNSKIRKISPDGIITTIAGLGFPGYFGDGGPASKSLLSFPRAIVVNAAGTVYVSDTQNNRIRALAPVNPAITSSGVVNAASFTAHFSPGALTTVFGSNFTGTGLDAIASLPLPKSLGGVTVSVNNVSAPVLYANSTQVNFQIPWETKDGSATLAVSNSGFASSAVNISVQAAAPGLFVQDSHAVVQNSDFRLNSSSNPAKAGDIVMAYLTGAGAVSPQPKDGAAAGSDPLSKVTSTVTATIASQDAPVSFAGLAPGFVGLWQVNIKVPSGLTKGDYPLIVTAGGQASNSAKVSVTP